MYTHHREGKELSLANRKNSLRSKSTLTRIDEARRAPGVTLTLLTRALSIAANGGSRFQARRATGTVLNQCSLSAISMREGWICGGVHVTAECLPKA